MLRRFSTGSKGFVAPAAPDVAVRLFPGTELLLRDIPISDARTYGLSRDMKATFVERDLPEGKMEGHQDALEFHNGSKWSPALLHDLSDGFEIEVISLPAEKANGDVFDPDRLIRDFPGEDPEPEVAFDHITDETEEFANIT